jgi:hypothetical protein
MIREGELVSVLARLTTQTGLRVHCKLSPACAAECIWGRRGLDPAALGQLRQQACVLTVEVNNAGQGRLFCHNTLRPTSVAELLQV